MLGLLSLVFGAVLIYMTAAFVAAWRLKRLDAVDIAWGGAFIVAAFASFAAGRGGLLQILVTALVIIWGVRLMVAIYGRFRRSSKEDPRYVAMRRRWKERPALNAYVRIFVVQAVLATFISLSVVMVNISDTTSPSWLAGLGAAVWGAGFLFESVGDAQLRRHLGNPVKKGTLMTSGLWRYTRHPNYFGEATQWWGIFIITLCVPFGWAAIISPLIITFLLLFVSGVPLTERRFEGRKGWAEYKRRTSVFVPLPPRE